MRVQSNSNNVMTLMLRNARHQACLVLLACLMVLGVASPANAGVTIIQSIEGIDSDETIRGEVDLRARAVGDVSEIFFKLSGPVEIQVVRSGNETSFELDEDGEFTPWDSTTVPDGEYKLLVFSKRNGEIDRFQFIKFSVDNLTDDTQTDTVQTEGGDESSPPLDAQPAGTESEQPETEQPDTSAPADEQPETQEPADEQPVENPAPQQPVDDTQTTDQPETEQPAEEPAAPQEQDPGIDAPQPILVDPADESPESDPTPAEDTTPEQPAVDESVSPTPETEQPVSEETVSDQPAEEQDEPVTEAPAAPPAGEESTEPDTPPAPEPELTIPDPILLQPFTVDFAKKVDTTYELDSGRSIPLAVGGELGADQDVLVLAWSVPQQRMVTEFAHTLTEGPWEITAEKLDLLPEGVANLQLHIREGNTTVRRVNLDHQLTAKKVPFVIGFGDSPQAYELGSGRSFTLDDSGDLDEGADVLVLAWSTTEGRMVDAFSFTLDGEPWTIPSSKLDLLPEGDIELQLIVRDERRAKQTHALKVSAPAPVVPQITVSNGTSFITGQASDLPVTLSEAVPADCELVALAWSTTEQRMVSEFAHTLSNTAPVIAAAKLNSLPEGDIELRLQVRQGGQVLEQVTTAVAVQPVPVAIEEPAADPAVRFVDTPVNYTPQSGGAIGFEVENLPAGGDVLILAWSDAKGALVASFGHSLDAGPWQISADRLNQLPAGTVELQLIVRGGDVRPKETHRINVLGSTTGTPGDQPTVGDEPAINPTPDPDDGTDPTTDPGTDDPAGQEPGNEPGTGDGSDDDTGDGSGDGSGGNDGTAPDLSGLSSAPVGFTTLTKHSDTRVVYVSSSRGSDSNDGLSEQKPVKSLLKGLSLIRVGKPDWLMLKAGDTWDGESFDSVELGGGGTDRPMVIGVYGDGPRPLIIPAHNKHGLRTTNGHIDGLVIQGLHFYPATRDPGSSRYIDRAGETDGINIRINSSSGKYIRGLVIEDCKVSHFDANIRVVDDWARNQGEAKPGRIDTVIRRNIVRYASGSDSHSIGIYIEGTRDSIIEQNLLDHNGWAQTDSVNHRNKRSHNIYAQKFNGPITVRYNIFTRGAAHGLQLRAGGYIENNLFVRNALAFYTSRADSTAKYNVILESDDINPDEKRGYGIEGFSMNRYEVVGNLIARRVGSLQRKGIDVAADNLTVKDNVIYDWADERDGKSIKVAGGNSTVTGNLSQEQYGGNEPPFVDPTRGLDTYAGTIGLDSTLEAFLEAASSRPRGQWIDELAPSTVSRYIRNGFELLPHD